MFGLFRKYYYFFQVVKVKIVNLTKISWVCVCV